MTLHECTPENPECQVGLRVLVVDNDIDYQQSHKRNLQRWGYTPVVAQGRGKALLDRAEFLATEQRCHAAIVDMRLFDDQDSGDLSGLELLERTAFRPLRSIVVTGYGSLSLSRAATNKRGAKAMVGKEEGPDVLREALIDALRDICPLRVSIRNQEVLDETAVGLVQQDQNAHSEIVDLLRLLSNQFDSRQIRLRPLPISPHSTSTYDQTMRRRSVIFRAEPDGQQALVVKIARQTRSAQEVDNFNTYVKNRLKGLFYPELAARTRLWTLGATAYRFIGHQSGRTIQTYREFFNGEDDVDRLFDPIRFFFEEVWEPHYDQSTQSGESLASVYNHLWKSSTSQENQPLAPAYFRKMAEAHYRKPFVGIRGSFLSPRRWYAKNHSRVEDLPAFKTCIVHGDLHGDNFFVNEGHAWLIDFERTGAGHCLADVAELEHDLLTRLLSVDENSHLNLYELAIALLAPENLSGPYISTSRIETDPGLSKAFHLIVKLRKLAADIFRVVDPQEYYWSLLFNALYVSRKLHEFQPQRSLRSLLLASLICERLEIGTVALPARSAPPEWPKESWNQVEWLL